MVLILCLEYLRAHGNADNRVRRKRQRNATLCAQKFDTRWWLTQTRVCVYVAIKHLCCLEHRNAPLWDEFESAALAHFPGWAARFMRTLYFAK